MVYQLIKRIGISFVSFFLSTYAFAADVDTIVIHALPFNNTLDSQQPSIVLEGDQLKRSAATSLGETLQHMPGIHNSGFGKAVGRPVIRGLNGSRVDVLGNGMANHDLSALSPDHAVISTDGLLAEQVEVLQGPSTLLYGPHAIGGVVNVVDGRMPKKQAGGAKGSIGYQYDSATHENAFAAKMQTTWKDNYTVYIDSFKRRSNPYQIPGYSDADNLIADFHEDDELPEKGVLENSDWDFQGGSLGFSYDNDRVYWGTSLSYQLGNYGLPGHSHHHEEEEEEMDEDEEHEDEHHDDHHEEESPPRLDLKQIRLDNELIISNPFTSVDQLRWQIAYTDYQHEEIEEGEVGTLFENDTIETRFELQPRLLENWQTLMGVQFKYREFSAIGDEALVPETHETNAGLFFLMDRSIEQWDVSFGARYDFQKTQADDFIIDEDCAFRLDTSTSLQGFSGALGLTYHLTDSYQVSLLMNHSKRMPAIEELYSCGEHLATNSFDRGNTDLSPETARTLDLSFKKTLGLVTGNINLFYYDFDDYIYADFIDVKMDEELNQLQTVQEDATLWGGEFSMNFPIMRQSWGQLRGNVMADYVRGETDTDNLPRISPWRVGASIDYHYKHWRADIGLTYVHQQDDTARIETSTDDHTLLQAGLNYQGKLGSTQYEIFLRGKNLLNQEVREHTSFIKDRAPQPGRSVEVGFRVNF